jgi:hypothetical protein
VNDLEITFRAPWYERERHDVTVNDTRSLRPVIQKYDSTDFVNRLVNDPQDSLKFTRDDLWSYPVPVGFPAPGTGRERFATSRLVTTGLRKLYQASHERFYAVVVELFCDSPGLPRAGKHDDLTVEFVLRRRVTSVNGDKNAVKTLAMSVIKELMRQQYPAVPAPAAAEVTKDEFNDVDDVWWAQEMLRQRLEDEQKPLLDAIHVKHEMQSWVVDSKTGTGRWTATAAKYGQNEDEARIRMWRLPPEECDADGTRSLWFGLVPTYSSEHWIDINKKGAEQSVPKLDERAIYEIVCVATQNPVPGHEHCPPKRWESVASRPFRLAAPFDPDGTKNRRVTIAAPDLRTLAARAGKPAGPGGLTIKTPPGSQFKFDPFGSMTAKGSLGPGGACTFAFELFFLVALFLFMMFLPVILFMFQLWWMLALRFCFPSISFSASVLTSFLASAPGTPEPPALQDALGKGVAQRMKDMGADFPHGNADVAALIEMVDATKAVAPGPPPKLSHVGDPLCPPD